MAALTVYLAWQAVIHRALPEFPEWMFLVAMFVPFIASVRENRTNEYAHNLRYHRAHSDETPGLHRKTHLATDGMRSVPHHPPRVPVYLAHKRSRMKSITPASMAVSPSREGYVDVTAEIGRHFRTFLTHDKHAFLSLRAREVARFEQDVIPRWAIPADSAGKSSSRVKSRIAALHRAAASSIRGSCQPYERHGPNR